MVSVRICFLLALFLIFLRNVKAQHCMFLTSSITSGANPSSELSVSWACTVENTEFQVTYRLTNRDQCDSGDNNEDGLFDSMTTPWDTATSVTLRNLFPYSTYEVSIVRSRLLKNRDYLYGQTLEAKSATTGEAGPSAFPTNITLISTADNTVRFSWNAIPCSHRNGDMLRYEYALNTEDGQEVTSGETSDTSITITIPAMGCTTYVFSLTAKNNAGSGPSNDHEFSLGVPDRVQNLRVTDTHSHSLTVSWDVTGECPAEKYTVKYELTNLGQCSAPSGGDRISSESTTETSLTVTGVEPYSTYTVYVKATNSISTGPESHVSVTTHASAPEAVPENITSSVSAIDNVHFTWDEPPCEGRNGEILRYQYTLATADNSNEVTSGETDYTFITITDMDLECYVRYNFGVAAVNSVDTGPKGSHEFTIELVPDPVQNLRVTTTHPHSLMVSWDVTSECSAEKYTVKYELTNLGQCSTPSGGDRIFSGNTTETSFTVTGVLPYSTYTVYVTPTNSISTGPESHVSVTTPESAPEAVPQSITSSVSAIDNVHFTWDEPPCGGKNGEILRYQYTLATADNPNEVTSGETGHTFITITDMDLKCYVPYRFSVAAINSVTTGPRGSHEFTIELAPDPAENLQITSVTKDDFFVSWNAPTSGCSNITLYIVEVVLINRDNCMTSTFSVSTIGSTDPNFASFKLLPYSTYTVHVTPRNDAGRGETSAINVTTSEKVPTDAPSNPRLTDRGPQLLAFEWDPVPCGSRGGSITYAYELVNGITHNIIENETIPPTVSFTDLDCLTNYTFKVRIKTGAGYGPWIKPYMSARTTLQVELTSVPIAYDMIAVMWTTEEHQCNVLFKVEFTLTSKDQCEVVGDGIRMHSGDTSDSPYVLTDLLPNSTYTMYVTPMVGDQLGEEFSVSNSTPASAPTRGPNVTEIDRTTDSLSFTWEEVPCESRGGSMILSYNYKLKQEYSGSFITDNNTDDATQMYVNITGLEPGEVYVFQIAAINSVGLGLTEEVTAMTVPIGPDPPENVSVVENAATNTSLGFTWTSATCDNSQDCINGYRYILKNLQNDIVAMDETKNTFVTVNNLDPCTTYKFSVAATDDSGRTGAYSQPVYGETAISAPSAVGNLKSDNPEDNSSSLVITWDIPMGNCQVDNYSIEYGITRKDMCEVAMPNSMEKIVYGNSTDLNNLESFSDYSICITPRNSGGSGPRNCHNGTTREQAPSAAPLGVQYTYIGVNNASFSWNEVQCGKRHGYIKEYYCQIKTTTDGLISNSNSVTTNTTFTGLQPCTSFDFSVAAVTISGRGPLSAEVSITTETVAPLAVLPITVLPDNRKVDPLTPTSVHWTPSPSSQCPVTDYLLQYRLTMKDQCKDLSNEILQELSTVYTNVTFMDLMAHSTYEIRVLARNNAGNADPTSIMIQTEEKKPSGTPLNATVEKIDKRSISFSWMKPACGQRNGDITMYSCILTNHYTKEEMETNVSVTEVEFDDLTPYVNYSFRVAANNNAGAGPFSEAIMEQTLEDIPPSPLDVTVVYVDTSSIAIDWLPPDPPHGVIIRYYIQYWNTSESVESGMTSPVNSKTDFTLEGLQDNDEYTFRIQAETSAGNGSWSNNVSAKAEKVILSPLPSPPSVAISGSSVIIEFDSLPEGVSNVYVAVENVQVINRRRRQESTLNGDPDSFIVANITRGEIENQSNFTVGDGKMYGGYKNNALVGGKMYNIFVQYASCSSWGCITSNWSNSSPITAPAKPATDEPVTDKPVTVNDVSKEHIVGNGAIVPIVLVVVVIIIFVILIAVVIVKRDKIRTRIARFSDGKPKLDEADAHENPVFKEDISDTTDLPPLDTNKEPLIDAPSVPPPAIPRTPASQRKVPPVPDKPRTPSTPKKIRRSKPIAVDKIKDYIDKQTAEEVNGFVTEFKEIPGASKKHPCDDAELSENLIRNRFVNILPYDHSRVKLMSGGDDPLANFINASLIKVYNGKRFIASQGPLPATVNDMWQLAWEQKSAMIIMLTNCTEKGKVKCHQYWPEGKPCVCGNLIVTPLESQQYADYTIRTFRLSSVEGGEVQEIKHFHFTSWPDFGVPEYPSPLLNFMKVVKANEPEGCGPPIIHCSAGVGRTGTYLTIDSMIEMAKEKGEINVPEFVANIREDRVNLVQTYEQYQFIFEALYEATQADDTSILITNLNNEYAVLSAKAKKGKHKGKTGLEHQFQVLDELTLTMNTQGCVGADPMNADKNRYPDKIPANKGRPILLTPGNNEDSTDYINAAFVHSYRRKEAYIVTQMPMPNTTDDIWRMVQDHNSNTIVMLNDMDTSDATIGKYWPDESSSITVGPLVIECQSSQKLDDEIIGRSFVITNTANTSEKPKTVFQFQYLDWPVKKDLPNSKKSFLALAALVQSQHEQNYGTGKITVHDMGELGRTGMFCAMMSMVDMMKSEKMVDVFQEVKRLRMCRPGMVENLIQYKFLYDVAIAYLDQYGSYENFSPIGKNGESSETESAQ